MISIIPALHIRGAGRTLMIHFALIHLLFAVLTLYTAFRLSGPATDRIIGMALQVGTVCAGPFQPTNIADTGCDEIGVLLDIYNYVTEKIITLMDSQKKTSDELRMMKFRALQAQIDPHFLYNTLDITNWLSQTRQSEKVIEAVQTLSRFYKPTLNRKELMNSIRKELEHISLYVHLQNMYYDNYVAFVVDVPEETCEYTVPELIFQPIVESTFPYGIMMKEKKEDSILLTGWSDGDDIIFIISDGEAGMPPEALDILKDDVNAGINSPTSPRHVVFPDHIDIYNTDLRLKSLYGEPYGLSFTSILGKGTGVAIWTPTRHIMSD